MDPGQEPAHRAEFARGRLMNAGAVASESAKSQVQGGFSPSSPLASNDPDQFEVRQVTWLVAIICQPPPAPVLWAGLWLFAELAVPCDGLKPAIRPYIPPGTRFPMGNWVPSLLENPLNFVFNITVNGKPAGITVAPTIHQAFKQASSALTRRTASQDGSDFDGQLLVHHPDLTKLKLGADSMYWDGVSLGGQNLINCPDLEELAHA